MSAEFFKQLKRHEGYSRHVYKCPAGFDSIGYGYNIIANPLQLSDITIAAFYQFGIRDSWAEKLLLQEAHRMRHDLSGKLAWWSKLSEPRQEALLNMAYNIGSNGVMKFKKTLAFLERGDYEKAAAEMLKSKWAGQVGTRAVELSKQIKTGKYDKAS